METETQILIQG